MLAILVALFAFPIGIATAVYLEEYAPDNALTRFIYGEHPQPRRRPSVVYGLLGLTIFVAFFAAIGAGNGRNLLAAMVTLGALVLPIVIITSAEALRRGPERDPRGRLRRGGIALGGDPRARPPGGRARHPDRYGPLARARPRRDAPLMLLIGAVIGGFSTLPTPPRSTSSPTATPPCR